jgi:hypothetical protein
MPRAIIGFFLLTALWATVAATDGQAAEISHCRAGERAWLNASSGTPDTVVSLCGTSVSAGSVTWVQFRMGPRDAVALRYPVDHANSLSGFVYRRYTRPRTTYLKLEFSHVGQTYAIHESFQADETPRSSLSLRVHRKSDGEEISNQSLKLISEPLAIMGLENFVLNAHFYE